MSLETELKFHVATRNLSRLAEGRISGAHRGKRSEGDLLSIYFDTKKFKLKRMGFTLRIRQAGDKYVQTVKDAASGNLVRGEWEAEVVDGTPDLSQVMATPLGNVLCARLPRKLSPIFQTSVHRIAQVIHTRRSEIELAIDRGQIVAGRHSRPIAEFELELKAGRSADLFRLARSFERNTGAELDLRSKSDRGYQLVAGGETAQHAELIKLDRKLDAAEAFRLIAFSALRHFATNSDAVRAQQAEAIHQMRVGLRRMRTAISLFDDVLPLEGTRQIKAELKWLTGELGPARKIDVFLQERVRPVAATSVPKRGSRAIEKKFEAQRKGAFGRARDAVASARFRRLLIDALEWIATTKPPAGCDRTIGPYAAELLERRLRKARKEGKRLNELPPPQRHKLRIKIKKIRYAVEFFYSLYVASDRKELTKLSDRLKKIQGALGTLNDFIAHREMAADLALAAPRINRRAQAFASGFVIGQEHEAARSLLKTASHELRRLHPLNVEPR
jgi:inorganic triphosphatase YgiF